MKLSVARFLGNRERVYRFALYGRTAAGKTCYLTALGLPRESPEGVRCSRLSRLTSRQCPDGDPESWDISGDPLRAFYFGANRLDQAEAALRGGDVPPATPIQAPCLIVYSFTHPRHGRFYIELIDYAGELIDPSLIHDAQKLASLLQTHLVDADGLIVLAEAPPQGQQFAALPDELSRLCQALELLHQRRGEGPRWSCPIALVFTKWDRRDDAKRDEAELSRFIAESPAAAHLRDVLLATATDGNFRSFAASAFGRSVGAAGSANGEAGKPERPAAPTAMPSYGLDEPLLWATERRDAIDLASYRAAVPTSRAARLLNPLQALAPVRWFGWARRLSLRLPPDSPDRALLAREARQHLLHCVAKAALALGLLIAVCLGVAASLAAREAQRLDSNLAFLDGLLSRAEKAENRDDLGLVEEELEGWMPYPDALSPAVRKKKIAVHNGTIARRAELEKRDEWNNFKRQYHEAMESGNVVTASELLTQRDDDTPELHQLKDSFRKAAPPMLDSQQTKCCQDRNYEKAYELIERARKSPAVVALLDRDGLQQLRVMSDKVKAVWGRDLYEQVRKGRTVGDCDRYLNSPADQRMAKHVTNYRDYLTKRDSKQRMRIALQTIEWEDWWDGYLNRVRVDVKKAPVDVKKAPVDVKKAPDEAYTCLLYREDVKSTKKGSSMSVGGDVFECKPSEPVEIKVQVWNTDGRALFSTRPAGVKVYKGSLLQLGDQMLELENDGERPALGAKIGFKVPDLPKEPDLPAWKE